ncbi:MAG: 3-ketoacyl-ACP reductase [Chloroflexi bacterium]|nr:3-ketoacyl-ACP reductase [Chloroflexota bacterium]
MKRFGSWSTQPTERVALVTGGSRGIGRGIVIGLARQGWTVVINYRGHAEAAALVTREADAVGGKGVALRGDIAVSADRKRLVERCVAQCGQINLLVNNAGMAPRQRRDILEATYTSYYEVMAVNLKGPYFLTQLVARQMIQQIEAGASAEQHLIINIGSISAYTSSPGRGEYCLSKAGMGMMTALYADRLAEYGIRVFEIRPGIIETDMTEAVQGKYDQLIEEGNLTPIARWGQPEDVSQAVLALVTGAFPFSTGEVINVDGGFHLRRL